MQELINKTSEQLVTLNNDLLEKIRVRQLYKKSLLELRDNIPNLKVEALNDEIKTTNSSFPKNLSFEKEVEKYLMDLCQVFRHIFCHKVIFEFIPIPPSI